MVPHWYLKSCRQPHGCSQQPDEETEVREHSDLWGHAAHGRARLRVHVSHFLLVQNCITVQHHVTEMVCRLRGPARGRWEPGPRRLFLLFVFWASLPVFCPPHTLVNVWCLDISCLVFTDGETGIRKYAPCPQQAHRVVGYIGGTDSYTVVWKLPCKDKAHFTLDYSSLLMFPSPQQDKELCSLRGHIYLVLHHCSRHSTVHDT